MRAAARVQQPSLHRTAPLAPQTVGLRVQVRNEGAVRHHGKLRLVMLFLGHGFHSW